MNHMESTTRYRSMYLLVIALAAISLALYCVTWVASGVPSWPRLLLPLLVLGNGIAGLKVGPFRSVRVRQWYTGVSLVAALSFLAASVLEMLGRVR
jgi:hypothetical protein